MKKSIVSFALTAIFSGTVMAAAPFTEAELAGYTNDHFNRSAHFAYKMAGNENGKMQFIPNVADHESRFVVRPNSDTLYGFAFYEIGTGYLIVNMPKVDRYQILTIWDIDHYITATHVGGDDKPFVVVKEGNPIPEGDYNVVITKTDRTIVQHRTLLMGAGDLEAAQTLAAGITVTKVGTPAEVEGPYPFILSENKLKEMDDFFNSRLGTIPWDNTIGYADNKNLDPMNVAQGVYEGLGMLAPNDARYAVVDTDADGNELKENQKYTLTVPADIPVEYFWSATVYDGNGFFVANEEKVYLANSTFADQNSDGSITVTFGNCEVKSVNCIPTTKDWNMTWRYYGPKDTIANGAWNDLKPQIVK